MKILLGGGTGFIGRYAIRTLRERGHDVILASRTGGTETIMISKDRKTIDVPKVTWDEIRSDGLPEGTDAVVNLAGENLMNPLARWGSSFKHLLWSSRIDTTETLVNAINNAEKKPSVFLSSSAIGYYAVSEDAEYTEDSPGGDADELAELCQDWEDAARLPPDATTRHVTLRIGLVLGREGGLVNNMITPFWFGVGGPIGSGKQWFPWIHVSDVAGIIAHAIDNEDVSGTLNATAPDYVTNGQFSKAFGSAMWRPSLFPVPAFVINKVFGKERGAAMLQGQKVIPKRTIESGYNFIYSDINSACKECSNFTSLFTRQRME